MQIWLAIGRERKTIRRWENDLLEINGSEDNDALDLHGRRIVGGIHVVSLDTPRA